MRNTGLGRQVLDHVTSNPRSLDMSVWVSDRECGTAACLAGWTLLLHGGYTHSNGVFFRTADGENIWPAAEAKFLLGLTDDEYNDEYDDGGDYVTLFDPQYEDTAIARFRRIVEAAEAERSA